jgi:preprotein translocase subunit SecG
MINILLFIHIIIASLLIIVILLQKTGTDGLSGIGGSNMGIVTGRSAANFLTKTTILLGSLFFINAIVLANLSSKRNPNIIDKIEQSKQKEKKEENSSMPIAK